MDYNPGRMPSTRTPLVTYDSTLLDHVSLSATSAAARRSIRLASVVFLTSLTAAAAQVSIQLPFTPVPFTLQPMVVLVGAAVLGARLGAASQILYLLIGIAGMPVFAASPILPQGIGRLLGPTGGYLLAYPVAAFVTGWLAQRGFDRRYFTSLAAMLVGLTAIFVSGVAWLAFLMPPGPSGPGAMGLNAALRTGLYPFILADFVKVALASGLLPAMWAWVRKLRIH
jgi:biotin transport system substrate-specific component